MKITFKEKYSPEEFLKRLQRNSRKWNLLYYLRCLPSYEVRVSEDPVQVVNENELCWQYDVKMVAKHIRLFGITIKTIKYE